MTTETKPCNKCGVKKSVRDDFYKNPSCADGRYSTCKKCLDKIRAENRKRKIKEKDNFYKTIIG